MAVLTYKDLNVIAGALALVQDEEQQLEAEPLERVYMKVKVVLEEAEDIEPKPNFKLARESE